MDAQSQVFVVQDMPEIAKYVFDYYLQRVQELKQVHKVCSNFITVSTQPCVVIYKFIIYCYFVLKEIKPVNDWIKPGESVTCVEKKIIKSDHPGADSDTEDSDDDNENDSAAKEENEEKIGPLEMDEAQKMDVDDINASQEINKTNVLEMDETMKED